MVEKRRTVKQACIEGMKEGDEEARGVKEGKEANEEDLFTSNRLH